MRFDPSSLDEHGDAARSFDGAVVTLAGSGWARVPYLGGGGRGCHRGLPWSSLVAHERCRSGRTGGGETHLALLSKHPASSQEPSCSAVFDRQFGCSGSRRAKSGST